MTDSAEKSLGRMPPDRIRFSQDDISYRFRGGGTIDELAEGLKSGAIEPESIPPIRLVEIEGVYYSLDNRRLEAFRRAQVDTPYRMATAREIKKDKRKFTTENDGISIRIRGDQLERPIEPTTDASAEPGGDGGAGEHPG